jgi:cytochrome P450
MSFAIFCLANHPEVQAKALEEQRELFGSKQKSISHICRLAKHEIFGTSY